MSPEPGFSSFHVDSALGHWTASMWTPPALAGAVECLWHFEGRVAHACERVFPSGAVEIIVHMRERYRGTMRHGGPRGPYPALCFTGLQLRPFVIEAPEQASTVLGIRLKAAAAWSVLGPSLADTTDWTVDLQDMAGAAALELAEHCSDARGPRESLEAAARWVVSRLARARPPDAAVLWMACEIERHHGAVSIEALRERTGWSRSRMAAAFHAQLGVSPKRYARVWRFRWALEMLQQGGETLAEIASRAGYYDQAHMNADFEVLADVTPGALLQALRYPNSSHLAEGELR